MAENKLADISTDFAIQILKFTDGIKGHYALINQLERSGTSIGANIENLNMPIAGLILCQSYRSHLKNVMKLNIGLR